MSDLSSVEYALLVLAGGAFLRASDDRSTKALGTFAGACGLVLIIAVELGLIR